MIREFREPRPGRPRVARPSRRRGGDGNKGPRMWRLHPNMWATADELADFTNLCSDPITPMQARTGFGYYGLGIYHHTPDPPDVPKGSRYHVTPAQLAADQRAVERHREREATPVQTPAPNPDNAAARSWTDITPRREPGAPIIGPLVAVAFIQQAEFPESIVVQEWKQGSAFGWSMPCLYNSFVAMYIDYVTAGCRWFGRPHIGAEPAVLGVWAKAL
jgi:hypothetical protein